MLPHCPEERLRQTNLKKVGIIDQKANTFNCRLVDLCKQIPAVLYLDCAMQHFPPRILLAAGRLHPNFRGVWLLSWIVYNLLLRTGKPYIKDWRDQELPRATSQLPPASPNVPCVISQNMGDRAYRTCPSATSKGQPVTPTSQKELRIKKELKRAAKKATVEEISQLEVSLPQAERAKDLAQFETLDKLIRLKQGMVQLNEAYLALANRGALLFEAKRDIAQVMPDAPHHCKYTGSGAMKQAVQRAKDRVEQYHCYQYRLIPHCPSVEEPPPPYTPGYYDPTTGQPYQGGRTAGGPWVSGWPPPALRPHRRPWPGVRGRPSAAPPRRPPCVPPGRSCLRDSGAIWPWGPEDEERLPRAMGAARIG
ncbi:hypothetical protein HPB48_003521 [Haemaphysalis longicornis]|uniref:Uncharacterized protein n=1 Tax=Haemaphysalis longicornis TaxID=44386 RepID=A0A9J6FYZ7_HAELO|nr:hypothetical protein HPB48_003521 [Haemaphysalis longicornis]